jgi:hypothetical protein
MIRNYEIRYLRRGSLWDRAEATFINLREIEKQTQAKAIPRAITTVFDDHMLVPHKLKNAAYIKSVPGGLY